MGKRNNKLYIAWGILFIVSALLGFIPEPDGLVKALLVLLGVGFFVPGGLLLYYAAKEQDMATMGCIRNLSLISLCTTFVLLLANFYSFFLTEAAGDYLYGLLVIASAPMVCGQFWAMSLFLWACLLMASLSLLHKAKKTAKNP